MTQHPPRFHPRITAPLALLLATTVPGRAAVLPTSFVDEVVTSGFNLPRAFALLPDGRALVLEQKTGRIRLVVGNHIASTDPIATLTGVDGNGTEAGAQGIAIDPQWPVRPYVYVFLNALTHRSVLQRFTASGALTDPADESMSLSQPMTLIGDIVNNFTNHNGGCLRFGPDGFLYLSLGEDATFCMAQDSTSLRGQVVRLRTDLLPPGDFGGAQVPRGLILPPGNPLSTPDSNAMLVWAYGLRNPWSFAIDLPTGKLYVADVGEVSEEELDEVTAGHNFGWPYREGLNTVLARPSCPEPGGTGNPANGYAPPIAAYVHPPGARAIFTAGLYRPRAGGAANWPSIYDGTGFYGDYYVGDLFRIQRDAGTGVWAASPAVPGQPGAAWGQGFLYTSDFALGADGSLYWLQQSATGSFTPTDGTLHRVRWTGPTGVPPPEGLPALSLAAGPNPFATGTTFRFTLPATARATVAIYDLVGRRVATLLDAVAPAGETSLPWDGNDESGRAVRAGMYVARLESAGHSRSARLLRTP